MDRIIDNQIKVRFAREAGAVRRLHNRPIVGHYDVAQHTFNILVMLRILHPEPPTQLIWACLVHDLSERFTGDIPAPAKWAGIINSKVEKDFEQKILGAMGYAYAELSETDHWWLKGLDMLEFLLFVADQRQLGNNTLQDQWIKGVQWMDNNMHFIPWQIIQFLRHAQRRWDGMILGEMQDYPDIMYGDSK